MPLELEVLQKLDALLNKHRSPVDHNGENAGDIPLLTDIVEPTEASPSFVDANAASNSSLITPVALNIAELSEAEVEAFSQEIFRHVRSKLENRISTDLRAHLAERLSSIIESTVDAAISDFKQELADIVGDAIAGALLERVERMAASKPDADVDDHQP